jgi:hypothetical protein
MFCVFTDSEPISKLKKTGHDKHDPPFAKRIKMEGRGFACGKRRFARQGRVRSFEITSPQMKTSQQ